MGEQSTGIMMFFTVIATLFIRRMYYFYSIVIVTSRVETTRGLFRDGLLKFEPRSNSENDIWAGTPSPSFHTAPAGGHLTTTFDLTCNRPHGVGIQGNRVSNVEPFSPQAETLPQGHRRLHCFYNLNSNQRSIIENLFSTKFFNILKFS
ncbi:hypothetical protein AVEN_171870-1 [Araneus ventricosus]|uniref:Uncharacterized protein n=1 Tax=Araneus ventricosus TaxID=182803 RepID=A0A4Y2IR69_ARAVE|nr:hypothetical protein AVEN_171870-1 [Araneus ventricosus]